MIHSRSQLCSLFIAKKFDFRGLGGLEVACKDTQMDLFYFRQFVTAFVTLKCTMTQWFHWPYEILSRISRLKSEKYSNVSRKKYDQNLLHGKNIWLGLATLPPFYLRPIPS